MKWLLPLAIICLISGRIVSAAAEKPKPPLAPEEQLQQRLDAIIIPKLELRDATFREALDTLLKQAREADPKGRGINVIVRVRPQEPIPEPVRIPGLHIPRGPSTVGDVRITVSLSNIPVTEALRYLTALSGTKFWLRPDGIHIVAITEPEPLVTREFALRKDFFSLLAEQGQRELAEKARSDFQDYLILNGAQFAKGASAKLNADATRVIVHNDKDQLELIETILESVRPPPPVPGPEVPKIRRNGRLADADSKLRKKSEGIVLLNVAIKDMSVRDAVRTLSELGVRYDASAPLEERGVNILVRPPEGESAAADGGPLISYSAKKVRLLDAIEAVAALGGRKARIENYAISLVPKTAPETLVTWEFLAPPEPEKYLPTLLSPPSASPSHPPEWLVSSGVQFEASASAIFIANSNRLIVRDTEEKLRAIQKVIEDGWRKYYRDHPPKRE